MAKSQAALVVVSLFSLAVSTPCYFPAIYNFGDSNSDTGAMSAAFWPTPPPYGSSFFGKPAGRNSDGRLIIDFIAEHLGVPYLSPYLDSMGTDFRHGANFATAGSTIGMHNETIFDNGLSPFPLDVQTLQHYQFMTRTSEVYNQGAVDKNKLPVPEDFSRALYTFDIGQNDITSGFRKLTMAELGDAIPDIVNRFGAAVTRLYEQGARAFWIHNTGPIGCLPAAISYFENSGPDFLNEYGCIKSHDAMAVEFNQQLKARVGSLRAELPSAALTYVDIYSAKYHLIKYAGLYGFRDPFGICCGYHENNVHVWCGQKAKINGSDVSGESCESPDTSISWDGVHYSEAANQWVSIHILGGSFSDPPIPISSACVQSRDV